jgi:hypothetical protein
VLANVSFAASQPRNVGRSNQLVKSMNRIAPIASESPGAGRGARGRRFAIPLLAGWLAFWLVSVVAYSCGSLIAHAQAGQEPAAERFGVDGPAGADPCPLPCPALADAKAAPSSAAAVSFDPGFRLAYCATPAASLFPRPAVELAKPDPGARFPPPVPFHQRTARLRI